MSAAGPLANTVAPAGLTLMVTGGWLPPQAIKSPRRASDAQRPAIAECLDIFRPARPTMTIPASGSVNGSHGERLSALRWDDPAVPEFGPVVVMVRVTVWTPVVPAAIGLAEQVTVASGTPLQTKVMGTVVVPVGVTVKVEVVVCPESGVAGVEGVVMAKMGATIT